MYQNNTKGKNEMISKEDVENLYKIFNNAKTIVSELGKQLISVDYINQNNRVTKSTFQNNLKSMNKTFLNKLNNYIEISESEAKKEINDISKYFDAKFNIYKSLINLIDSADIQNYIKIIGNVNEMVEGVKPSVYSKYKKELNNSMSYIKKQSSKILEQMKIILNKTSLKDMKGYFKTYQSVINEIKEISAEICSYDRDLKYFIWECKENQCSYMKNEITYKGLPKINAPIMETLKTYNYTC